jgi:hypothetical protein
MPDRRIYTASPDDVKYLKDCAGLPFMQIGRKDPWDLIQARWESMSRTMGFDLDTVEIVGLGPDFTAVPLARDATIQKIRCLDCDSEEFFEGPSGGLCTNYKCSGCGSEYNVGPGLMERIHRD